MRQVAGVVGRESQVVHDSLARNDIKMFQGAARFVGPNELVVSGFNGDETLRAKKFLIGVGTRPAESRGVTLDGEIAVTSDSLLNLKRLPRSGVVVGAGVIGIEYASMFAALGLKVTVVDKRPRPLEFLDHEIVDELIHQLRKLDPGGREVPDTTEEFCRLQLKANRDRLKRRERRVTMSALQRPNVVGAEP